MAKMSKSDLRSILDSERSSALSAQKAGKLTIERTKALDYYMGDMSNDMPVPDGQSSAISSDVADTIDSLIPDLMDILCGGDQIVRFDPNSPKDVAAAEQETDYVNHVFMHQNNGFMAMYSYIKDALMLKTGVFKVSWESKEEITERSYYDIDDQTFTAIINEEGVEILEHTEKSKPGDGPSSTPQSDAAIN
jgi:hypothetical protein